MERVGFTLIELIITIAIIALIAMAVFVAVNPAKRIGQTNDSQRWADLTAIAKAVEFYTADNGSLPSDFLVTNIDQGEKLVLCSSAASRTCDSQTRNCLVVNDSDFLGSYLPELPIDPEKSADTDTGYYITRGNSGNIVFGACSSYISDSIYTEATVAMNSLVTVCGDGNIQGDEVCDDGDLVNEGCGNGTLETAGSDYCNSTCTATIVISSSEVCDYNIWTEDCESILYPGTFYTVNDAGVKYCSQDCSEKYAFDCR